MRRAQLEISVYWLDNIGLWVIRPGPLMLIFNTSTRACEKFARHVSVFSVVTEGKPNLVKVSKRQSHSFEG